MRLWSFILVLALATGLGVLIRQDPGYALFSYGDWSVEMPLWITALLTIALVIVIMMVLWFINTVFSSSNKVKFWWKKHKLITARRLTYRGLLELEEGRWQKAEKALIESATYSDTPVINYLSAAKAAEGSGSVERRDRYLQLAFEASSGSDVVVRLTQAELQHKHGELEKSIRTLQRLHQEHPTHPKILRLLSSLYESTNEWQLLLELLPDLRKADIFPKETLDHLQQTIYCRLLPTYENKNQAALIQFWNDAPRIIQRDPVIVSEYAKVLMKFKAFEEAENILRYTLKKTWSDELIYLYGMIEGPLAKKQLKFAESFLENYPRNPYLLLTLGRLSLRNQLWGKARDYLEDSLNIAPEPETYAELAQLMGYLGESTKQEEYFKKGLLSATQVMKQPIQTLLCLSYENTLE